MMMTLVKNILSDFLGYDFSAIRRTEVLFRDDSIMPSLRLFWRIITLNLALLGFCLLFFIPDTIIPTVIFLVITAFLYAELNFISRDTSRSLNLVENIFALFAIASLLIFLIFNFTSVSSAYSQGINFVVIAGVAFSILLLTKIFQLSKNIIEYQKVKEITIGNKLNDEVNSSIITDRGRLNRFDFVISSLSNEITRSRIRTVLLAAVNDFEVQGGKLYVQSAESELKLFDIIGVSKDHVNIGETLQYGTGQEGEGMAGTVMVSQKALIVNDYPAWKGHIRRYGHIFSTVIEVPVRRKGETIGVLSVFNNRTFEESDIVKMKRYAHEIQIIIDEACLEQQKLRFQQEPAIIKETYRYVSPAKNWDEVTIKIIEAAESFFTFSRATLQQIKGDGRKLLSYKMSDDLITEKLLGSISDSKLLKTIIETKRPYIMPDTSIDVLWTVEEQTKDVKSWIGIPLIYEDKVIALMTLDNVEEYGYYDGTSMNLLSLFGQTAAVILKSHENIRKQAMINHFIKKVVVEGQNRTDVIFQKVVDQAAKQLSCPRCKLFMPRYTSKGEVILYPLKTFSNLDKSTEERTFKSGLGIVGAAFQSGKTINVPDTSKDDRFSKPNNLNYIAKSILAVPLNVNGVPIGVLSMDHHYLGWFDRSDENFVESVLVNVAAYVDQSRSLEQLLSLGDKIVKISDVNEVLYIIAKTAVELTRVQSSAVFITDSNIMRKVKNKYYSYPQNISVPSPRVWKGLGLTSHTYETGKPKIIRDTRTSKLANPGLLKEGIISIACIPIMKNGRGVAALFAYFRGDEPYEFSNREIILLKFLGMFIRNRLLNSSESGIDIDYGIIEAAGFDYILAEN